MAREQGRDVDMKGFEAELKKQKERPRGHRRHHWRLDRAGER
jgi:alanyl-tRNA synthetase